MDVTLPLEEMNVEDKLRAIETLWEDLRHSGESIPVPNSNKKKTRNLRIVNKESRNAGNESGMSLRITIRQFLVF